LALGLRSQLDSGHHRIMTLYVITSNQVASENGEKWLHRWINHSTR
jgi:hypothetical protein